MGLRWRSFRPAIQNSNSTVGGDYVNEGQVAMTIRSVGLFGGGIDPTIKVLGMKNPVAAASYLRDQEERRIRDIRKLVITSVNNQPIRVEDVVEGGRAVPGERSGQGSRRQPSQPDGPNRVLEGRPPAPSRSPSRWPMWGMTSRTWSSRSC